MNNNPRTVQWTNNNLIELSQLQDDKGINVLHKCGKACCETSALFEGVCKVRNESSSEWSDEALFNTFKTRYYNSDNFTKEGNTITLIFEECTCPMVKNGVTNSFLCNCTLGFYTKLLETLFDKKVSIEIEKSILQGDAVCKQKITILDH